MHLVSKFFGRLRRRLTSEEAERAQFIREFPSQVDFAVKLFSLNPELPEVADLKGSAEKLFSTPMVMRPMWWLKMLNPDSGVHVFPEGNIVVQERMFGHVLQLWSVVRHHIRWIDDQLIKIIADNTGTHLIGKVCGEDFEWARLMSGTINPRRMADPGNRYEIACAIIKEFTGVDIDWRNLIGRTEAITVVKSDSGHWDYQLKDLAVTS